MLKECHECDIVYDESTRHVHAFHRMIDIKENSMPKDLAGKKGAAVLLIGEHRVSGLDAKNGETRIVMVSSDGTRFIIEVRIHSKGSYHEFGEFSSFEPEDYEHVEELVRSLISGAQEDYWTRVRASANKEVDLGE